MATLYLDSCAAYRDNTDVLSAGGWAGSIYSVNTTGGRWGNGSISYGGSWLTRPISSAISAGAVGFVGSFPSIGTQDFFYLSESAGVSTVHLGLGFVSATDSRVELRNAAGTLLGTTTKALTISGSVFHVVEMKFNIHDTTGSAEVWIDGIKEIDVSGVDTRNGGTGVVQYLNWVIATGGTAWQLSEVYVNDTTGSAPNNTTWAEGGGYRIHARRASAAGNYAQWTPLSSTNVSNIDDANGHDSDTSYNSSSTANQKDTFQFGAIPSTAGTITAIMHRVVARKDDANNRTIRPIQRQSSTDYNGTTVTVSSTSYMHFTEVKEINPSTGVAYTVSEMRATTPEFGYELVS